MIRTDSTDTTRSHKDFVLATDLDGTFLGGSDEDRRALYTWIEQNRDRVELIFVTGRDPDFIRDLTKNRGVPRPAYVIGDVGTTIARMDDDYEISPIVALEETIAAAWGDAGARVQQLLAEAPGLSLQNTAFRYRLSYDMDPADFDPNTTKQVEELGLDTILSDDRFFDVLPPGVSKGPSLLKLLEHLKIDQGRVLVAGDTMNDLSMLATGLPAVAVGGSEAALIEAVNTMERVYCARGIGTAGIIEAITHHDLFSFS